jgi:muconate cycloisomerase
MRRFPVALMADEVLQGPESAFEIAKQHGADVFAIKIEQSGGLFAAQRVATIADAAGIELYGGTMLEGAFSTAASAHLFASFANLQWGTELFGPLHHHRGNSDQPLDYSDFELTVPTGGTRHRTRRGEGQAIHARRTYQVTRRLRAQSRNFRFR